MKLPHELERLLDRQPYPLLFATVSGAHLYGFPSADSDWDLRGVHCLPVRELVGLDIGPETLTLSRVENGVEADLVTHEAKKFFTLLLNRNGYVLEQLHSPIVARTTPWHAELREVAKNCVTRHHAYHYLGFAKTQWELFRKDTPPRVKPLLYLYRVLLTGIHLMRTGETQANILALNESMRLPYIDDLVQRKVHGKEKGTLDDAQMAFHEGEYARLRTLLETERDRSALPEAPTAQPYLHELLLRIRA